jgi:hypothetical protein
MEHLLRVLETVLEEPYAVMYFGKKPWFRDMEADAYNILRLQTQLSRRLVFNHYERLVVSQEEHCPQIGT